MTIKCKTPGLRIEWDAYRDRLYANLLHASTGLCIRRFESERIKGGKRKFAAKVDSCASGVDWTRPVEQLAADKAAKHAACSIPYDCRK